MGLREPGRRALRRTDGSPEKDPVARLYEERDYLEAYRIHTDLRVEEDPQQAIGGSWTEIGELQFEFLRGRGLLPHHSLLDIGCGTLRGGRHFIRYLDARRYTGMDISVEAIRSAEELVEREGLGDKAPRLLVNEERRLRFGQLRGERFDFLLAQSVFTHLMPEHIEECFEYVGEVMHPHSIFYFTFFEAEEYKRTGRKSFSYPYSFFAALAERTGFRLEDFAARYPHPRGQRMVGAMRPAGSETVAWH
jgi:SAM-dependent methyltransferase